MTEGAPEALDELPPSAKLVYKALEMEGSHTTAELEECTGLPERTLRYAVERLLEEDVVEAEASGGEKVYRLATGTPPESG